MTFLITPSIPETNPKILAEEAPSLLSLHATKPRIGIITPSSPEYAVLHEEYNACNTIAPLAIVFPATTDQLRATVQYCSTQTPPLPLTVRGGGHDAYGRNALASAVQLDLRFMKWVRLLPSVPADDRTRVVAIGPGITAIEMQQALDERGLSAGTGWVGTVGVTGWSCGGGYGISTGLWGMGADNVLGAHLITADGQIIDTDDDDELLWALRGAGLGNFGVICELRLRVRPKPRFLAGVMAYLWSTGDRALTRFQRLCDEGLPHNFSGELTINTTEQLGPTINVLFTWISDEDASTAESIAAGWAYHERLVEELGAPALDTVAESSILEFHEHLHRDPAVNARGYWYMNSLTAARLSPELIDVLLAHPAPAGGTSAVLVHHAHGRALQPDATAAWAHREEHFVLTPSGFAPPGATPEQKESAQRWANGLYRAAVATNQSLARGYWSLSRPEHCDVVRFFGDKTVARLRDLKRRLNPRGLFPAAQPVLEGGGAGPPRGVI
ncbi:FAD binding domain protein [Thozetella sp. PMI_491]|nr:FAD binding domain protein [Thozetella sp. PMI_491]